MNIWRQFQQLLPGSPLSVAQVTAHNGDSTSTVLLPGGGSLKVRGQSVAVGSHAFIRDREIRGQAPAVTPVTFDV